MPSIIDQILHSSIDEEKTISTILRMISIASSKLKIFSTETWVASELNGYQDEVPDYRYVHGELKARYSDTPWTNVQADPRTLKLVSRMPIHQAISTVEDMTDPDDNTIYFSQVGSRKEVLNRVFRVGNDVEFMLQVSTVELSRIVGHVRNLAMEWGIEMDRLGVKGCDFDFSNSDKERAKAMNNFNFGDIGSITGGIGVNQTITASSRIESLDFSRLRHVADELQKSSSAIASAANDANAERLIETLSIESAKTNPDTGVIHETLSSLRTILTSAASGIITNGTLEMIRSVLPQ